MITLHTTARVFRFAIAGALLFAIAAGASTFSVDRTDIRLSAKTQTALITVRNDGDAEIRFQLGVFTWDQDVSGEYQLAPTQDVVVFPTLLALAKGESRRIRVGATTGFGSVEKSYRLFIEELPAAATPAPGAAVTMRTKVGLPVFLEPATRVAAIEALEPSLGAGVLRVPVHNTGNVHVVADNVVVRGLDAQGTALFTATGHGGYVLAGGTRAFEQTLTAEQCRSARELDISITVNGKATKRRAAVADGACAAGR